MKAAHIVTSTLAAGALIACSGMVCAQNYPAKPVRIITGEPGGGSDLVTRPIAQALAARLGQQVIVDNRAGGVVQGQVAANAAPDGYTLFLPGSNFWLLPLMQKAPYDPVKDFSPISLTTSAPNVLVVHPSLPATSVKELVALAKAKPGELNYSSGGIGSSNHLAAELFKAIAGLNIVRIPFKGTGPALTALLGAEVQLSFPNAPAAMTHVKSGRLRGLAVTSSAPSVLAPGLPTMAASGLPGYESTATTGLFAPAKTPAAVVNRLNQEVVYVLNQADLKKRFLNAGVETVGSSVADFAAAIKSEMTRMDKVIKDAGIKAE